MEIDKKILTANTTWKWTEDIPEYPATDFRLRIILRNGTGANITVDSEANGRSHSLSKGKDDTASLAAGLYVYQFFAIDLDDENLIYAIAKGTKEILADITQEDARTHELKVLEELRAAELTLASKTMLQVTLGNGMSYTYKDLAEVQKQIALLENKLGISNSVKRNRIKIQFTND